MKFGIWKYMLCVLVLLFHTFFLFGYDNQRIALVIGNSEYRYTSKLANPVNDAEDVAAALEMLGFDVLLETDLTRAQMDRSVREFVRKVTPDTEAALFYYAGHGVQYEGVNYLLPVNADIQQAYELLDEAFSMDRVTAGLDQAGSSFNLIILDACRDNPFVATRTASRGLSVMGGGGRGSMVVFATAPGTVAQDGTGRNSPFTQALLEYITVPGLEVRQIITEVQRSVQGLTGGRQVPWVNTSFTGEFYFSTVEEQLTRSQEQARALQQELDELEAEIASREAAIRETTTPEESRRLEAEQQRARAEEAAKLLEAQRLAELQRQAEEILASQEAQDALRREMEQRLSSQQEELAGQAEQRRRELEQLRLASAQVDSLYDRLEAIAHLNRSVSDIQSRYQEALRTTLNELDQLYRQRIEAFENENPRDPWETADEHRNRVSEGVRIIEQEQRDERHTLEQEFTQRIIDETEQLLDQTAQAKEALSGMRFIAGPEAVSVQVHAFDPENKRFPITVHVHDSGVSYTTELYYVIDSDQREVLREEYYRVFSADQSGGLIGQVEYSVIECKHDIWMVIPLFAEVINILEEDAVLVSQGHLDPVQVFFPSLIISTEDQIKTISESEISLDHNLVITGLPEGTGIEIFTRSRLQSRLIGKGTVRERVYISDNLRINISGDWVLRDKDFEIPIGVPASQIIWLDFAATGLVFGELHIPRNDLSFELRDMQGDLLLGVQDIDQLKDEHGVVLKLPEGEYQILSKLSHDRYFTRMDEFKLEIGKRKTFDPGPLEVSVLYQQEQLQRQLKNRPLQQAGAWGLIGAGAVGIAGSIYSYFMYSQAVDSYNNAEFTGDAVYYRDRAQLWSNVFTICAGIGLGGSAAGGFWLARTPSKVDLENQLQDIDRRLLAMAASKAEEEAREAFDGLFTETRK